MNENPNVKEEELTEDQIDIIASDIQSIVKDDPELSLVQDLPSNNGVEVSKETSDGDYKKVSVAVDPNTGENVILGEAEDSIDDESFEEMCDRISKSDFKTEQREFTSEDIINYLNNKAASGSTLFDDITEGDFNLDDETIKSLLVLVNRKLKGEKFNVYKEFPVKIRTIIDKYITTVMGTETTFIALNQKNTFRDMICNQLIDEFVDNITMESMKTDLNSEIEHIFEKGNSEIAESVIGYTQDRNKAYREFADNLEDEEKKEKINTLLNQIDEAYDLNTLKEFSKKCKVKSIEIEKPHKVFNDFLNKYKNSKYNIYDINMARPILFRNLNAGSEDNKEKYSAKDIDAFFICFCKQCRNMKPENTMDHAYMYYVMYNIVLTDINKSDSTKVISDAFLKNVKEIIANIKARNQFLNEK